MKAPWLWCRDCGRKHRIGNACPPRVPSAPGLDRIAAHYWWRLNADMADTRAVEATGLAAIYDRKEAARCRG